MAKVHAHSWEVTDEFWKRVEPLVPQPVRDPQKQYKRAAGAGRPAKPPRLVFEAIVFVLRTGCQWRALPFERFGSASAIHQKFMLWSKAGFFENLWRAGLAEYDDCEGIASTGLCSRPHWRRKLWGQTRRIGEKKGSKRHLLVDGRGVPLSLVVTGANAHDVTQLEAVLASCMVKRPTPKQRRSKHLCADAGYRGDKAMKIILAHGYIPHVVSRKSEAVNKQRHPEKKARRWVVEACHSWFNRFRKLLVRYEKLEHTFLALNHLAAAIITLRKIKLPVNIIYG